MSKTTTKEERGCQKGEEVLRRGRDAKNLEGMGKTEGKVKNTVHSAGSGSSSADDSIVGGL